MPTVTSTSELSVELFSNNMNSVKCDGQSHGGDNAQARCHILNVQNLAEGLYVAISVPPRAQASAVTVTVSFLGTDSPPPGMTLTDSYTRTRRVATSIWLRDYYPFCTATLVALTQVSRASLAQYVKTEAMLWSEETQMPSFLSSASVALSRLFSLMLAL
jgi:hypothetical protein